MKKVFSWLVTGALLMSMAGCSKPQETGLKDGTYSVVSKGIAEGLKLDVTFDEGKISSVVVVEHGETPSISDLALERIPDLIVKNNSVNVDVVAGATFTSNGIIDGVKMAIEEAGGKVEDFNAKVENTTKQEEVEKEVDVVIAGAGLTGLTTAIAAAEKGLNVLVVEKAAKAGGSLALAMGSFFSVNGEIAKEAQIDDNKEDMMALWHRTAEEFGVHAPKEYPNYDRVSGLLDEVDNQLNWLQDKGVNFVMTVPSSEYLPAMLVTEGGASVSEKLEAAAKAVGVEFMMETPATELLVEDGKVIGLKAESDTLNCTVHAKHVVLATGGFGNNVEMMNQYHVPGIEGAELQTAAGNVGDGIKMAEKVGAAVYEEAWPLATNISTHRDFSSVVAGGNVYGFPTKMLVDQSGKRYVDEANSAMSVVSNALAMRDSKSYAIYDSSNADEVAMLEKGLDTGVVFKADTIEELAKLAHIDADALVETYDNYNQYASNGVDADFNKDASCLVAYGEGPYYAVQAGVAMMGTYGGVKTDNNSHVLNKDGQIIEGLYAVGEMSNREYYNENYVACASLTLYSTAARLLGESLEK